VDLHEETKEYLRFMKEVDANEKLKPKEKELQKKAFRSQVYTLMKSIAHNIGITILSGAGCLTLTWATYIATLQSAGPALCGVWAITLISALGVIFYTVAAIYSLYSIAKCVYALVTN